MGKKPAARLVLGLSLLVSVLLVGAQRAEADTVDPTTYTYTGNLFTTFIGTLPAGVSGITGSFTLANPLDPNLGLGPAPAPLSFSFSDGATTLTDANAFLGDFEFSTDSAGNITNWSVIVDSNVFFPQLVTQNALGSVVDQSLYSEGPITLAKNVGSPGTWTVSSPTVVPEPSSLILLGTGLFGLAPLLRRRGSRGRGNQP